jgi:hypothetical protein
MTGKRALSHPWGPWAGGDSEAFEQADVRALGKLKRWGDARVLYLVRLVDGAELFVIANQQPSDDEKWLRKLAAEIVTPTPTRDCGWAVAWKDVPLCSG